MSLVILITTLAAVNVILSHSKSMKEQTHKTIQGTDKYLGNSVDYVEIYAEDGSDKTIEDFTAVVRLSPSSKALAFSHLNIELTAMDFTDVFEYNDSLDCSSNRPTKPSDGYAVKFLFNVRNHSKKYLEKTNTMRDIVRICFHSSQSIPDFEELAIRFYPLGGSITTFSTKLPRTITRNKLRLYPG